MPTPDAALRWVNDHVDRYLDGDLTPEEQARFAQYCTTHPACQAALDWAETVQTGLHRLAAPPCPDTVVNRIYASVDQPERRLLQAVRGGNKIKWIFAQPPVPKAPSSMRRLWQPMAAAAVLATFIFSVTWLQPQTSENLEYTPEEVAQAVEDIKWTMAFLSDLGQRTNVTIKNNILQKTLIEPVNEALLR